MTTQHTLDLVRVSAQAADIIISARRKYAVARYGVATDAPGFSAAASFDYGFAAGLDQAKLCVSNAFFCAVAGEDHLTRDPHIGPSGLELMGQAEELQRELAADLEAYRKACASRKYTGWAGGGPIRYAD